MMKNCSIEGCDKKTAGRGFCKSHYMKKYSRGEFKVNLQRTHGMYKTPEYISWDKMKQRCYNSKHNRYHIYGARGITVCDEWKDSFPAFYADMGNRPEKYTIDRIDSDKGYYPDNCRWASVSEQNANKRKDPKKSSIICGVRKYGKYKWVAQIGKDYNNVTLGVFKDLFEALAARKSAEVRRDKEFNDNRLIS